LEAIYSVFIQPIYFELGRITMELHEIMTGSLLVSKSGGKRLSKHHAVEQYEVCEFDKF